MYNSEETALDLQYMEQIAIKYGITNNGMLIFLFEHNTIYINKKMFKLL